jgi:hypothetical protein
MMLPVVNRIAFLVQARGPYFDWARSVENNSEIVESEHSATVYLAKHDDTKPVDQLLLKRHFERIFEEELNSWWTDRSVWPEPRTWEMFQSWFIVTISDLVHDLEETDMECF